MYKVLINAYACAPNMGSEPGMAWNWIINLANYCKLYVITEGEWKDEIEAALVDLPQANNIKFYYNPLSPEIRKMCWNQGDWRFYYYYRKWQRQTLKIAEEIVRKDSIDIVHQLNMIGFREPGYLWKINTKPFIWGPVDAKERFPVSYLQGAGIKANIVMRLKNSFNYIQLKASRRVHQAVKKSQYVISASGESLKTFKKYFKIESILINETGCYVNNGSESISKKEKNTLDILWVGKFDFRKQLGLALQTVASLAIPGVKLHIIGDDQDREGGYYKKMSEKLNINNQCIWYGSVSHHRVQEIMRSSDLFFFTSVAEGTPHVILEAIGNNLPVLCFNTCGQGDSVNEMVGVKIELTTPAQSVRDFVEKIEYLYYNREKLVNLSKNCFARQLELSWDKKAQKMVSLYHSAIDGQ